MIYNFELDDFVLDGENFSIDHLKIKHIDIRAKKLLKGRKSSEIINAALELNELVEMHWGNFLKYLLYDEGESNLDFCLLTKDNAPIKESSRFDIDILQKAKLKYLQNNRIIDETLFEVYVLKDLLANFDPKLDTFQNGHTYEYLAIFSLVKYIRALGERAIGEMNVSDDDNQKPIVVTADLNPFYQKSIDTSLIALDLIESAELEKYMYETRDNPESQAKVALSKNGKKGAIKKHEGHNKMKEETIKRYKEIKGKYKSLSQAALKLKDGLWKFQLQHNVGLLEDAFLRRIYEYICYYERKQKDKKQS
jgi:hypothetical protein